MSEKKTARTTISLEEGLYKAAMTVASENGQKFSVYLQRLIEADLQARKTDSIPVVARDDSLQLLAENFNPTLSDEIGEWCAKLPSGVSQSRIIAKTIEAVLALPPQKADPRYPWAVINAHTQTAGIRYVQIESDKKVAEESGDYFPGGGSKRRRAC